MKQWFAEFFFGAVVFVAAIVLAAYALPYCFSMPLNWR